MTTQSIRTFRLALLLAGVVLAVAPSAAQTTTGITLSVAEWLPTWNGAEGGGWTAVPTGTASSKMPALNTEAAVAVPPGTYDVYWVQDADHDPMKIAAGVLVEAGATTEVRVRTGITIEIADWVPPLHPANGYWGAVATDLPDRPLVNWTVTDAGLVLPPGEYDFFWDDDDTDDRPPIWLNHRRIEATFGGIGLEVREEGGRIVVVQPLPGGPAERAGLMAGDVIAAADGAPLVNIALGDAVALMRGEAGTNVTLTIERAGAALGDIVITRDRVEALTVLRVAGGVRAVPDPAVPALEATGGWWGVTYADEGVNAVVNWANTTDLPLLVGRAYYDIYWVQNPNDPPRLVAEDVPVDGQIVDVPIPPAAAPPVK